MRYLFYYARRVVVLCVDVYCSVVGYLIQLVGVCLVVDGDIQEVVYF